MIGVIAPMSVIGEVTISSPGSGSMAATAAWIAAVPEAQAETCVAPISAANSAAKLLTNLPLVLVSVPLRIASVTSAISSSPSRRPLAS